MIWPMFTLLLFLGGLVYGEYLHNRTVIYFTKPLASLSFLWLAWLAPGEWNLFFALMFSGLLLGAGGDVALMIPGQKSFKVGLYLFLSGHLFYTLTFMMWGYRRGLNWGIVLLFVGICVGALAWMRPHFGKLLIPAVVYSVVITLMVITAWHFHQSAGHFTWRTTFAAWGTTLFFFSDLAVARDRFVKKEFINRAWGLPTYYIGQMLIALSLHHPLL
jgi:uncharacterized membrane protein YhhN